MEELIGYLSEKGIAAKASVSGAKLTTFGSGGTIGCLIEPKSVEELIAAREILRACKVPYRVIGGGSNLLLPDEGYAGALIRLSSFRSIEGRGKLVKVGAGVKMPLLAKWLAERELSGLEFACGIPGMAGGAAKNNAGAFSQMISNVLVEAEVLTEEGSVETLPLSALQMGYHSACFPEGAILLSLLLRLKEGKRTEIEETMRRMTEKRRATQPQERSAGSVFRRVGETPAAQLIEKTGLKGKRIGGAELSLRHCNFIVNKGSATTEEYFALAALVKEKVRELTGVTLAYEVERICSRTVNSERNCMRRRKTPPTPTFPPS